MSNTSGVTFTVLRASSPSGPWIVIASGVTSTSYVDNTAQNGVTYYYEIQSENAGGLSAPSNILSATPQGSFTVPTPPTLVSATGGQTITLGWTAPSSNGGTAVTQYTVLRGSSPGTEVPITTLPPTSFTFSDSGLESGATYYYTITAQNSIGSSPQSNELSATVTSGLPGAPTQLVPIAGNTAVALGWDAPSSTGGSSLTGYNILRGTSATSLALVHSNVNALEYTDTGLTNGQEYWYAIEAVNSQGAGPQSNIETVTPTGTPATTPSAPLIDNITTTDTTATLTWLAPGSNGGSPITGYNILRSTSTGTESIVHPLVGTALTYTDSGLTAGTEYFYEVTATNAIGTGPKSNEYSATTTSSPPPPPATGGLLYIGPSWPGGGVGDKTSALAIQGIIGLPPASGTVVCYENASCGSWGFGAPIFAQSAFEDSSAPGSWTPNATSCVNAGIHIIRVGVWEFNTGLAGGASYFPNNYSGFLTRWQQMYQAYNQVAINLKGQEVGSTWFNFIWNPNNALYWAGSTAAGKQQVLNFYPEGMMGTPGTVASDLYTGPASAGVGQTMFNNQSVYVSGGQDRVAWGPADVVNLANKYGHDIAAPEWSNRSNYVAAGDYDDGAYMTAVMTWAGDFVRSTGRNAYLCMWTDNYPSSTPWNFVAGPNSVAAVKAYYAANRNIFAA